MQFKTFAATFFIAFAAALPTEEASTVVVTTDAAATNAPTTNAPTTEVKIYVSKKTWQAAGHCEFKYSKLENCNAACYAEATTGKGAQCPDFQYLKGRKTGGCLPFRDTCECSCVY
ncbi:hypothetical protein PgNI_11219 [Pyricularia grisea]|uniref:Uncharacterized protein n=1 Tax=Pyricularia grisea TaxID=148305 RepID=A0A6P8APK9_PYRGI|nr:hypothetical protein PgNI_11219 [Pyricularia grisea]TLD03962.1 hypothetical protein PgNI_11219 [Pyricularia grisea]